MISYKTYTAKGEGGQAVIVLPVQTDCSGHVYGGGMGGGGLQALTAAHALVQVSAQGWGVSYTLFFYDAVCCSVFMRCPFQRDQLYSHL